MEQKKEEKKYVAKQTQPAPVEKPKQDEEKKSTSFPLFKPLPGLKMLDPNALPFHAGITKNEGQDEEK